MGGRRALLGPADVQDGVGEIDLIPAQVYKLGRPQAVAEGDKDHAGIPVHVCRMGLEGVVSKRVDSPYRSGPSKTWLKTKSPASEAVRRELRKV